MATTDVILTEQIPGLGVEADVVTVKAGFARNYLLPRKKAHAVTPANLRRLNQLKGKRAAREAEEMNQAEELARRINKIKLALTLETGEKGKAFGSITSHDLAERLKGELGGLEIERHRIQLDRPIKETGTHEVPIKIHADVIAKLVFTIKAASAEPPAEAAEAAPKPKGKPRPQK
jgi:large subunit ribosomal protein L9